VVSPIDHTHTTTLAIAIIRVHLNRLHQEMCHHHHLRRKKNLRTQCRTRRGSHPARLQSAMELRVQNTVVDAAAQGDLVADAVTAVQREAVHGLVEVSHSDLSPV
jgi:hypothetical protein